jgi:adenylate cyclase
MLVLVVDDVNDSRQLLVDIVSAMGMRAVQAANGPDTLSIARQSHPDLILLDVNMPGMSGFQVLEALKTDPATAGIPIIMLTALSDVDSRVTGLKLGADDYIAKPYNPRELMERVRTRLRSKQATDELRAVQTAIRETFERYVAPAVVEQLLRDPAQVKLGGTLQEITVLFLDLEGFTTLSERTEPEKLLAILNQYHTLAVNCVRDNGGTVDKFLGDGLMALYNTPLEQPDHALRAVRTALQLRDLLDEFHDQFAPDQRMKLTAGIHTGPAVVGNVGAPDLMNFTAVGDTVNVAARLESISSGGTIMISQATLNQLPAAVRTEPIGVQRVKGRAGDVMTYAVLSEI